MRSSRLAFGARLSLIVASFLLHGVSQAEVFLSQQQALALAFPDCDEVRERTYVLTPAQSSEIERIARSSLESQIVTLSSGWKQGKLIGHAFIDVHTIRTQAEALMVVVDASGAVARVKVLAFHEPLDYLPTDRWFEQFMGKTLEDGLRVGHDIHGIVGASLSTRAVSQGVRRALAIHRVLVRDADDAGPVQADPAA